MSGGWNAMHTEREAAKRLWEAGHTRKIIAKMLGVSVNTVSKWRWQDKWANRKRYADRPILEPARQNQHTERRRYALDEQKPPRWARCPHCGGKADAVIGHPRCGTGAWTPGDISATEEAA